MVLIAICTDSRYHSIHMLPFMVLYASSHIRFVFDQSESDWQYLLVTQCQDAGKAKAHSAGQWGTVVRMGLGNMFPNTAALLGSQEWQERVIMAWVGFRLYLR